MMKAAKYAHPDTVAIHRDFAAACVMVCAAIVPFSLTGCDADSPTAPPMPTAIRDADMCDDPDAPDAASGAELAMEEVTITSNDGSYRITITPEIGMIPRNRYFALRLTIEGVHEPIDDGSLMLAVSGAMPHHEHGLNTRPIVDMDATGSHGTTSIARYRVHGLLLHMPGSWELYFDITEAGITERAQFALELP